MLFDIVSYEKPEYKLLKIKPDSRLTNTFYDSIINTIHSIYTNPLDRLHHVITGLNGVIQYETIKPITYEILFDGDNKKTTPYFYFGIPTNFCTYIKQRIQSILPNSTLTFEDDRMKDCIDTMFSDCYTYEFHYAKKEILSLKTKENNLLESILSIKNDIEKGEGIIFQVEMKPISNYWKSFHDQQWQNIRDGENITDRFHKFNKVVNSLDGVNNGFISIMDDLMGYKPPKNENTQTVKVNVSDFSTASRQKTNYDGFKVCIKLYVIGCNKVKADSYATSFQTSLMEIEEDNRLQLKKCKKKQSICRGNLFNKSDIMSSKELASIVNIPNQKLQRTFKIDNVNMKVNNIPNELINSDYIRIGTDDFHGEIRIICLPTTKRNRCLCRVYMSKMGAGKSNILLNNMVDSIKCNNGMVVFDHINVGETTNALTQIFSNKIVVKNPKSEKDGFGFYYPELAILDTDTIEQRLDKANDIAYEVQYTINSIATNADNLSEIMLNYLFSACKVVFSHYGKTLQDFINVLTNKKIRHEYIDKCIEEGLFNEDSFEIQKLINLDKDDKEIKGLLERLSVLQRDTLFSKMLRKPYSDNDNFIKYFDNNIPLSILMTNEDFPNKKKKDILCTFLLGRIRLAMMKRKDRSKVCDIYIDEPQSLKKTMDIISESVYEVRKYGISYVLAIQGINQLGVLKEALFDAGCHWFLLKGCNEGSFNELKSLLNDEFEYSDLIEMEKWHSLNIISIDSKTYGFITKYPNMLLNSKGKPYIGD